jgi:hypothetical protein
MAAWTWTDARLHVSSSSILVSCCCRDAESTAMLRHHSVCNQVVPRCVEQSPLVMLNILISFPRLLALRWKQNGEDTKIHAWYIGWECRDQAIYTNLNGETFVCSTCGKLCIRNLYCLHAALLQGTFVFPPNSMRYVVNFLASRAYRPTCMLQREQ